MSATPADQGAATGRDPEIAPVMDRPDSPTRRAGGASDSRRRRLPRIVRFDEHTNVTRRRGVRIGWLLWKQDEPPYHYEWRWVQVHVLTWDRRPDSPALKVQFEVKTYRTLGNRSNDGTKRYLRFGVCL